MGDYDHNLITSFSSLSTILRAKKKFEKISRKISRKKSSIIQNVPISPSINLPSEKVK